MKGIEEGNTRGDEDGVHIEVDKLENDTHLGYHIPSDEVKDNDEGHITYFGESSYYPYSPDSPFMVVRCALTQQKPKDDLRRSTIFYIYAKWWK